MVEGDWFFDKNIVVVLLFEVVEWSSFVIVREVPTGACLVWPRLLNVVLWEGEAFGRSRGGGLAILGFISERLEELTSPVLRWTNRVLGRNLVAKRWRRGSVVMGDRW